MARTTPSKLGASNTIRQGYESLTTKTNDPDATVGSDNESQPHSQERHVRPREDVLNTPLSSDDDSLFEDEADVKLLPLKPTGDAKQHQNKQDVTSGTPSASIANPPYGDDDEPHDVGQRIEQLLESERTLLSKSFNLDLEDGSSLQALSDLDDDDYGYQTDKNRSKGHHIEEDGSWRSRLRSLWFKKPWWQILLFLTAGLMAMWLATKGFRRYVNKNEQAEYVRVPRFNLDRLMMTRVLRRDIC